LTSPERRAVIIAMITIAATEPGQAREAARLYHDAWHESQAALQDPRIAAFRDETFFLRRVEKEIGSSLAAWDDSRCVGYAAWRSDVLERLFIAADARRLGIGRELLRASEEAMKATGVREASLNCLVGNHDARRFYERRGWLYAETRTLQGRWAHGSVDVEVWKLIKMLAKGT